MSTMVYSDTHPDNQQVKCVVIGDTGVGKTRLICAQACGTKYKLSQLMQSHAPTVWAIDHYRNNREVSDKSWSTVDGMTVSLQLWDTFGYHDKDRKFAYGKADVVLVCFSTVRPRSLRNVSHYWLSEIRRYTGAPIILCGTQIDLRYLYNDPEFLALDKGPFYREIHSEDIVTPEMGRHMASEVAALHYYETSVLVPYGIEDVFENVIRVALVYKREKHFWNILSNSLKRVDKPQAQEPFLPPRPKMPQIHVPVDSWEVDMHKLYSDQMYCDVVFKTKYGSCFEAHKFVLATALPTLKELFHEDNKNKQTKRSSGKSISRSSSSGTGWEGKSGQVKGHLKLDTVCLLDNDEVNENVELNSDVINNGAGGLLQTNFKQLDHPVFQSIEQRCCLVDDSLDLSIPTLAAKTVITLNDNIKPAVFQHILRYMYTWTCDPELNSNSEILAEIRRVGEMLDFPELVNYIRNIENDEDFLNKSLICGTQRIHQSRLRDISLHHGLYTDAEFELEDGRLMVHRAMLMVRSDMMACMFSNNFKESSAKVIPFPEVSKLVFSTLLQYLYSGNLVRLVTSDLLEVLQLANQLCLLRLQALTEDMIIREINSMANAGQDVYEEVAMMLEQAQLHNAPQLADWCMWYLSCDYMTLYKKHNKLKQSLKPENQVVLSQRRWPPVWYLKERDYYEKCQIDLERQRKVTHSLLCRRGSDDTIDQGCLGFCSRKRRKIKYSPRPESSICV